MKKFKFRHPKTVAVKKSFFTILKEEVPSSFRIRGKRTPSQLPSDWDDIIVSPSKSWKGGKKKKQYL